MTTLSTNSAGSTRQRGAKGGAAALNAGHLNSHPNLILSYLISSCLVSFHLVIIPSHLISSSHRHYAIVSDIGAVKDNLTSAGEWGVENHPHTIYPITLRRVTFRETEETSKVSPFTPLLPLPHPLLTSPPSHPSTLTPPYT